jgi:hypothetical protein
MRSTNETTLPARASRLRSCLPSVAPNRRAAALGLALIPFILACSDPATTPGAAPGTGGSFTSSGGSATALGGSVSGGTGGAPATGGQASTGTTGGRSVGGMAGRSAGGQSGATSAPTGGRVGGGGGEAPRGGGGSGGVAGASTAGRGGASGGAAAGAGGMNTAGSGCKGGKVVHFVYFVEADQTQSDAHRNDLEKQAFAFQEYWFEQLGVTFYLNEPVVDVIEADHPAAWYLTNPDGIHDDERWYRLGNIKNEVYRKLGIRNFDPNHRVVNYPTTRNDGRVGGNFGGAWMDGDDLACIATGGVNYPYDDGNSAHCLGHVAHEFGHVLGLDHEGPMDDCMQFGFYAAPGDPMCTFSSANVAKIKADPDNEGWLNAMPGQTCAGDALTEQRP